MPDRSLALPILGGAAVVVLSGVAAFFGAGLAQREPAPIAPRPAPTAADSMAIEAHERRIAYLERRVELLELRASVTPDAGHDSDRVANVPPLPPGKSAVATPANPETAPDSLEKRVEEETRTMIRTRVVSRFSLMADAGSGATARRFAQAVGDSTLLITMFGLRGDDVLERVRKVYVNEWETAARDIGPIVHDGLERSDITTVRERMRGVWTETDRLLRPLFDDDAWKVYESKTAGLRKPVEDVLDEFEKARLGGK